MNKEQLKNEIEKLASEMNISFLKACTAMQSAANGNEEILCAIGDLKEESEEYKNLFL